MKKRCSFPMKQKVAAFYCTFGRARAGKQAKVYHSKNQNAMKGNIASKETDKRLFIGKLLTENYRIYIINEESDRLELEGKK